MQLTIGQYNLLCPVYGVKWGEREACLDWKSMSDHGASNWEKRWPALLRVMSAASWDLLALEELEDSTREDVEGGLTNLGLELVWFNHPGREDALGIAYNPMVLRIINITAHHYPIDNPRAAIGCVDFRHVKTQSPVRMAVAHLRGGPHSAPDQWNDLLDFVMRDDCMCIICGDMNEEFGSVANGTNSAMRGLLSMDRNVTAGEPRDTRPPHKMDADQTSGKGKVDYIFVRTRQQVSGDMVHFNRDAKIMKAILLSHTDCIETNVWPSDHGLEALTLTVEEGCST